MLTDEALSLATREPPASPEIRNRIHLNAAEQSLILFSDESLNQVLFLRIKYCVRRF